MSYESLIEATTTRCALEWYGVPSEKFGQHGYPDRIYFIPGGRPLLIEFKSPGETPRPLQQHRIQTLQQLGYDVEVHDDDKEALASIYQHLEAATLPEKGYEVSPGARLRRTVLETGPAQDQHDPRRVRVPPLAEDAAPGLGGRTETCLQQYLAPRDRKMG